MLTPEQLELRRHGVSGSEIAAVAGLNPYRGAFDVWRTKMGTNDEHSPSSAAQRGTYLEPAIIRWYEGIYSRRVEQVGTLVSKDNPIIIATPDGISAPADGDRALRLVLEVKCPSWRTAHHWHEPTGDDLEHIPDYYAPQVMWEMAVTGLRTTHVCAFMEDTLKLYTVPWHQELYEHLVTIAERFWRDHVVTGKPPPIDGSPASSHWLEQHFARSKAAMKPLDNAGQARLAKLRTARNLRVEAEKNEAAAINEVKEWLGDAEGCEGDFGRVLWRNNKDATAIDYKSIVAQLRPDPLLVEQHTITKPGPRVFRPTFRE